MLNRAQILEADDRREEVVEVPQWGGAVLVRELSAGERIAFELAAGNDERKIRTLLVVFCVVDAESKQRLFGMEDLEALAGKSWRAIRKLSDVALRLSALDDGALERAKENFTEAR